MIRLSIHLNETEAETLARWAALEMRDPRDQVRFLIRQELLRRGLLPDSTRRHGNAEPESQVRMETDDQAV
jgi:hypothetical protein